MIKVAVLGASGRMGRAILGCLAESDTLRLRGAVTIPSDPDLGRDAGEIAGVEAVGVPLTDDRAQALHGAQVAIDFTLPGAVEANVRACEAHGTALVIGTTGLGDEHMELLDEASHVIPIVYGRNMSVGVNVFMEFVERAAHALGDDYDVEIVEAHHRHKVDAPSGTALALGQRVAEARGRSLDEVAVRSRDGQIGPRVPGTIGFSVIRGGSIVGEHSVRFIAAEEQLEFAHHAIDRRTFARGALRAAQWLAGRAPGLYTMGDVLGLSRDS
jgi:4-hydroxy-tetrahydrodipicolinate reductase